MRKAGLMVLMLLVAAGCSSSPPPARSQESPAGAPRPVRVGRVVTASGGLEEVPASIESAQATDLASRVSAVIEKVTVEEGDLVEKGKLLVRIDARDLRAQISAAEAASKAARAHLERIRSLFGKDAATSQELEAAEQQEAAAAAGVQAARAQLDYIDIRAPFTGWVTGRMVDPGDMAAPGRPLLSLQSRGRLRAVATVAENQVAALQVGQLLDLVLNDGTTLSTRVTLINPAGDMASRRFEIKCDLPDQTGARPGAFARLHLPSPGHPTRLIMPRSSAFERGGLTGVFVVADGIARLRWISPGESEGDGLVVRAGVTEGEMVVLEPGSLTDGTPVAALEGEVVP